ncbi:glycosyl transferase [Ammoniphilus oxalaticus]|uniref:Glycosyl transferase n=1 Tax=Ammoniphilus oxalaticus TaxID=66863 RepID=A0A419SH91_9BACL|nr:glycosyltransferase family 4 protein [Ammoniphilus oxalaticus]RKD23164.1 glycosyl transferase [Ammoniphilus oxalaticus]
MSKKVLFCATVDYHFELFHLPYLKWFKEQGWEIHVAAQGQRNLPFVDQKYDIPIQRSPFKKQNIFAYTALRKLMDEHRYELVHCHTPMGGALARLAARRARKRGAKVIYTAHGFHFCQGAPLLNWLLYYPIEKQLARYTDCLITINQEDYQLARRRKFKAGKIVHVHGVGVDSERFAPITQEQCIEQRQMLGYEADEFLMLYAAEFNQNKNQQLLLHALAIIHDEAPQARLVLAGEGPLLDECKELARRLGIEQKVDFLGFRNDLERWLPICDLAVASSLREGLPVNIMEAMACGLPVVASDNRGHRELVKNDANGWVVATRDVKEMAEKIKLVIANPTWKRELGLTGRQRIDQTYSERNVLRQKTEIYSSLIEERAKMEELTWVVP